MGGQGIGDLGDLVWKQDESDLILHSGAWIGEIEAELVSCHAQGSQCENVTYDALKQGEERIVGQGGRGILNSSWSSCSDFWGPRVLLFSLLGSVKAL